MENIEEIKTNIVLDKMVYDTSIYNYYDTYTNKQVSDKINNRHNDDINTIINKEFNNNSIDIDEEYITFDPFNKLNKYQTNYTISEKDILEIHQYNSVEEYLRERERQLLIPLEKQEPQLILKYVYDSSDCVTFNKQQKISQNKQQKINNKKSKKLLSSLLHPRFNWKKYFSLTK